MKAIYKYLICSILIISNLSCSKFLDIDGGEMKPIEAAYYRSEADFRDALLGTYAVMTVGQLYGNRFNGRIGLEVDEGACAYDTEANGSNIGLYSNIAAGNSVIHDIYGAHYKGLAYASKIINRIDDSEMSSGVERDHIKGQAKFLRAFYYLSLVNLFGDIPMVVESDGLTSDVYTVPRVSQEEVLEYIVNELKEAGDLLKPMAEVRMGIQANQSAAWSLLARVYLKLASVKNHDPAVYADAAFYAKKVIDLGYHELNPDYKNVFEKLARDEFDPKEMIFEVNFMGNYVGAIEEKSGTMQGRLNGIMNRTPKGTLSDGFAGYSLGAIVGTKYLFTLYSLDPSNSYKDVKDARFLYNLSDYYYFSNSAGSASAGRKQTLTNTEANRPQGAFGRFAGKFRRENELTTTPYDDNSTPQNVPVIRYSDVLLMYAEALIRSNPGDAAKYAEAIEYVNIVRRRSIADLSKANLSTTMPSQTGNALAWYGDENVIIQHVIEERARELCFEGLRKFDLNRWGIFYKRAEQMKTERGTGNTNIKTTGIPAASLTASTRYYENIQPHHELWPIPQMERASNSNLSQNPGY